VASSFIGFLIVLVLLFLVLGGGAGTLSGAGPLLFVAAAVLAVLFVPALRRLVIGLVVLAFLASFAYSAINERYQAAKGQVAAVADAPEAFATSIRDALFVPGLYTLPEPTVLGSWWDWVQHGYRRFEGTPFVKGAGDRCCIDPNDIEQGRLGDCFILASLAALASTSPGTLANAIQDVGDGNYDVTLYVDDGKKNLVKQVVRVTDAFPGLRWFYSLTQPNPLFAQVGEPGSDPPELWVMLIESAFAQAYKGGYLQLNLGGRGFDTLQALTGRTSIVVHPHEMTQEKLGATLASLERSGYAITAGSVDAKQIIEAGPHPLLVGTGGQDARLVSTHEYYVRHYDAATQTVTLGNTHTRGATVQLTLSEFHFAFDSVFFNRPQTVAVGGGCQCP
jgi:hypothetical protein